MRLITDTELTSRTDVELAVLFQMAAEALATTIPGSPARNAVVASLQNISRAKAQRYYRRMAPGF
jgi:hypothetical protein